MTATAPIACTLTPGGYADRVRWIADLNRASLRRHERSGRTLTLTYEPGAESSVRRLAEQEATCCAFLDLRVHATTDALRLVITAPDARGLALDELFAPFLEGAPSAHGSRVPGLAATTASAAALACGVCCVLPVAMPAVMLTGAGSVIAAFAHAYRAALVVSLALTAAGWAGIAWQSARDRRRPGLVTLRAMAVATVLVAAALSWPLVEPLRSR